MLPSVRQAGDGDLSARNEALHAEALRALSEVERLGAVAIATLRGLVAYWSPELVLRLANEAYENWFGSKPGALVGITMRNLAGERLFALDRPHALGAARGQYQQFRHPPEAAGQTPYLSTIYVPHIVGGEAVGFLSQTIHVFDEIERIELLAKIGHGVAAPFDQKAFSVTDEGKMAQLVELMGREWVDSRLDKYLAEIERVATLPATTDELIANIHSLAGMAGNFGFTEVLCLCADIQREMRLGFGLRRNGELRSAGERCRAAVRSRSC